MNEKDHLDVLVVGAGLSGIGAGCQLQRAFPNKTYAVLEARDAIGGTWDLFRYPGIRSDSDMFTFGYSFRPWMENKSMADASAIRAYIEETAREYGVDQKIRFRHRVERASWSSETSRWTVDVRRTDTGEVVQLTCSFLFMCTGYYDYERGHTPDFPGTERFGKERIVHPQKWTDDIDYSGKRVVVIGSGATAVTLVPALTKKAAHVTMLQRSPSYVVSVPSVDYVSGWLRKVFPATVAHALTRLKYITLAAAFFTYCRHYPKLAKKYLLAHVKSRVGKEVDVDSHFTPPYRPWEQRLCMTPDAEFFEVVRTGAAEVVTDHIETFTESGIRLKSGRDLPADLIVTATGLRLLFAGDVKLFVDGLLVDPSKRVNYKGVLLSEVPNFAVTLGYPNASWTLKADLVCEYVCRLLAHMYARGYRQCIPREREAGEHLPMLDFSSGYVQRGIALMPRQGSVAPWRLYHNYYLDLVGLRYGKIDDDVLEFRAGRTATSRRPAERQASEFAPPQ